MRSNQAAHPRPQALFFSRTLPPRRSPLPPPPAFQTLFLAALLSLVFSFCASAQGSAPPAVHDCHPCTYSPGPGMPTYDLSFQFSIIGEKRIVTAIELFDPAKLTFQRFPVHDMQPLSAQEDLQLDLVDINFDGFKDIALVTRREGANLYAAYWLYDPRSRTETSLGSYPLFHVDPVHKRLDTYERGEGKGVVSRAQQFSFINGHIQLLREEIETATDQPRVVHRTVRQRVNKTMQVTESKYVQTSVRHQPSTAR